MEPMDPDLEGLSPDLADPLVVLAAWLIGAAIKRWAPDSALRHAIPTLAICAGVSLRALIDVLMVEGISIETLLKGASAGLLALYGHSQGKEIKKAVEGGASRPPSE